MSRQLKAFVVEALLGTGPLAGLPVLVCRGFAEYTNGFGMPVSSDAWITPGIRCIDKCRCRLPAPLYRSWTIPHGRVYSGPRSGHS
ncbi:hypothetical protein [Nocardia sp. NPDC059239]|uniref:hypothetical protein n=1 Tax=Nocardia sp. NPDC059239 TaxID=3346785 RepID=UPI0036A3A106